MPFQSKKLIRMLYTIGYTINAANSISIGMIYRIFDTRFFRIFLTPFKQNPGYAAPYPGFPLRQLTRNALRHLLHLCGGFLGRHIPQRQR